MDFYDRVLIRLKRRYSKDEAMAAFIKKLNEAECEVGKLTSEVAYLEHQLSVEDAEAKKLGKIELKKEELYNEQTETIKNQIKEIKELTKQRDTLLFKVYTIENQSKN